MTPLPVGGQTRLTISIIQPPMSWADGFKSLQPHFLMIRHILIHTAFAVSCCALAGNVGDSSSGQTASSTQAALGLGSKAPALKPEKWLKGEPVASYDPVKVYLIECWATWCGPCLAAIPHLNQLHNEFKDQGLIVIGANVMGDTEEKAAAFVARKGDKMAYRVAYDGKTGNIAGEWLQAAGVRGIPHAFLVRGGSVLWHGHPSELTEVAIRELLQGGTIATKSAAEPAGPSKEVVAYRKARLEILGLLRAKQAEQALALIAEKEAILSAIDPADPDVLCGMAYSIKEDPNQPFA